MGCTQCHRQFQTVKELTDHVRRSHPKRTHTCKFCSYTSNRRYDVDRHSRSVHGDRERLHGDRERRRSRVRDSSERLTPIRSVQSAVTPVPKAGTEEKRKEQKARSETPLSISPQSDQELTTDGDFVGPTARSVIVAAKDEVVEQGLTAKRRERKRGRHYRRVTETVVFPDGRVFRVETEEWE